MTPLVTFGVVGTPIPQGSMKAFIRGGKPRVVAGNAGALERWRGDLRSGCVGVLPARDGLVEGPVGIRLDFRLARPKSHYHPANSRRQAQELRADAPDRVAGGPDLDKLARAVLDALTGIVYVDDRQVAELGATKRYAAAGLPPGVDVRIVAL